MLIEILVDVWLIEAMLIRNFIKRNIFHFIKKSLTVFQTN